MMFRGHSEHSIDAKGRTCLPAKFRDALARNGESKSVQLVNGESKPVQLVVTRGADPNISDESGQCLFLYPLGDFEEVQSEIARLKKECPEAAGQLRKIERTIIAHAEDLELDKQGRILLPEGLRKWAGIGKDIVCVGQGKRMELWSPERWNRIEALADAEADSEEKKVKLERVQMAVGL
jgi:Uncharacterized protein conserved in bacteria